MEVPRRAGSIARMLADPLPETGTAHALAPLLMRLRLARFAQGVVCPRCGAARTQRWGGFAGRQRYRCRGCRRTFSDLTGTPAAYTKKLELWAPYAACMAESLSVRRAARRTGIHRCTSFRWRHALLRGSAVARPERLAGWIELAWWHVPYSEKGKRPLARGARTRGPAPGYRQRQPLVSIVAACDRHGQLVSFHSLASRPAAFELARALGPQIDGPTRVLAAHGRFGPASAFAHGRRGQFRNVNTPHRHPDALLARLDSARAYLHRLREWLKRFCGVATRYLHNYLAWHRALDRAFRLGFHAILLRWP